MDISALRRVSARIGSDPLLVQGAGGNTSVKLGNRMVIKASGFWLADALEKNTFVSLDYPALRQAALEGDPRADTGVDFVIQSENPDGLRPSIETCVHAVFDHKYVVHVHCVRTLSYAVREDAEAELSRLLEGLEWIFVPYVRPGSPLVPGIVSRKTPRTNIVVLGNHGLIVAGETLEETEALLREIEVRLDGKGPRETEPVGLEDLCAGSAYQPARDPKVHALAFDEKAMKIAAQGPLYPDHVIFLGPEMGVRGAGKLPREALVPMVIVPHRGVVLARGASAGAAALARCLTDVLARLPSGVNLRFLEPEEIGDLTSWDAEKYRQKLSKSSS